MTPSTEVLASPTASPLRAALIDLAPVLAIAGLATACIAHCATSSGGWSACVALMRSIVT